MDLMIHSPRHAGVVAVDFTVVSAISREALQRGSALREGVASSVATAKKVRRYQNCRIFAFPVEDHGRLGEAALELVRLLAPAEPQARSAAISGLYQNLSCVLQRASADAVIAAFGTGAVT